MCKQNLFLFKTKLAELELFWQLNCVLMQTELFEIKLTIGLKVDLALNNLQRLICSKIQPNNQPANIVLN